MDKLLTYIRSLTDFSDETWVLLQPALSRVEFKKNEFLLKEGQICNTLFFIEKGYCRSFYNIDGTEMNTNFFFENEIATSPSSFGNAEKSKCSIIACEPLETIRFDKDKLVRIAESVSALEKMGRHFIRAYATKQEEFADLIKLYAAEERLTYIEKKHPEMIQRIPLSQLASFLGVTRETLSRIRKQRNRE